MDNTWTENYLCAFVVLIHAICLSLKRKHATLLEKSGVSKPSEQPTMTSYTQPQKKYKLTYTC